MLVFYLGMKNMSNSGVARVFTKAKEIKDRAPDTTIFLNAGTSWQGRIKKGYPRSRLDPTLANKIGMERFNNPHPYKKSTISTPNQN